jgi:hypothetical protein
LPSKSSSGKVREGVLEEAVGDSLREMEVNGVKTGFEDALLAAGERGCAGNKGS